MATGLYDDIIAPKSTGLFDDLIRDESDPVEEKIAALKTGIMGSQAASKSATRKATAYAIAANAIDIPGMLKGLINQPNRLAGLPDMGPLVSTDQIKKAASFLNPLAPSQMPQDEVSQQLMEGAAETASGLTAPENVLAAVAAKRFPTPVSTYFAGETLGAIPESTQRVLEATSLPEAARALVPAAANVAGTGLLGRHLAGPMELPKLSPLLDALTGELTDEQIAQLRGNATRLEDLNASLPESQLTARTGPNPIIRVPAAPPLNGNTVAVQPPPAPPVVTPTPSVLDVAAGPKVELPPAKGPSPRALPQVGETVQFEGEGDAVQSGKVVDLRVDEDQQVTPIVQTKDGLVALPEWQSGERIKPVKAEAEKKADPIQFAAIRMPNGDVHKGQFHPLIEGSAIGEHGFVTKSGQFLTRDEAENHPKEIAVALRGDLTAEEIQDPYRRLAYAKKELEAATDPGERSTIERLIQSTETEIDEKTKTEPRAGRGGAEGERPVPVPSEGVKEVQPKAEAVKEAVEPPKVEPEPAKVPEPTTEPSPAKSAEPAPVEAKAYVYHSPLRPVMSLSQYLPKDWKLIDERTFSLPKPLSIEQVSHWDLEPADPRDPVNLKKAYQKFRDELMKEIGESGGGAVHLKNGRQLIVSETVDPKYVEKYPFRITSIDKDGVPSGHEIFKDWDEVSRYLNGFRDDISKMEGAKSEVATAKVSKASEPKLTGHGKLSKEFDDLIRENGLQLGWVTNPDALYAQIGDASSTASIKAKIAQGKAMAAARQNAARDMGLNPTDVDTMQGRAKMLEALKQHVKERMGADTLDSAGAPKGGSEFLPESKPALELAAPESVEGQKARLADEAQKKAAADKEAAAKADMLARAGKPLGGDLGSAGQGSLFPEPGQQEMFKAGAPKPKWSSATDENGLGGQMLMGIPDPIKTYKAAVALTKAGIKALTPAARASAEAIRQVAHEVINSGKMTDYRRSVLNWSAKLQRSFGEASEAQRDIMKRVPNESRRAGITNWIEANGDTAVLTARRDATADPKLRAGYDAALTLTPEETAVAQEVRGAYNALGLRGDHYDVLKSFKDNYVTHIWNLGKSPGAGGGGSRTLKERFKFSRASTFPTFFDGEQAGFVPKTKDIAKLLPVYLHEMNSVIAARQLVQEMSKGVASDGRPLVAARGTGIPVNDATGKATLVMPKVAKGDTGDYKTLENQPALHDWRWAAKDDAGNPIFLKADLALHPEAYNRIKAVLGKSAIREWYNTPTSATAAIPKAIVKGIDLAQSETKRTMLGLFAPFHQVQEGFHGIGHRVNPLWNIPKIDLVNDGHQMDAARHGLMLLPDRASEGQFMEGFKASGLVSKIPIVGPMADFYSHYLFHEYIPGLKYKTYQAILERNQKVFAGKLKPEEVKALSAEQANAAYGHLNYADLGRNPTMQHLAQLGLLAPDFLEARGRFAGQALRGATGAKVGREQIIALATLAVAQATLAWIGAKTTGGDWDHKRPFEFRNGTRKYTMRSVPEDIYGLTTQTRQFVNSRLAPLTQSLEQFRSGVDWRGQKVTAGETAKEMLAKPIPLTVRELPGLRHLTGSDRPGNVTPLEQLAGALGLRISRANPREDLNTQHGEWLKNNKDPRVRADYERNAKATYPTSKYKEVDSRLADRDDKAAMEALQSLRQQEGGNEAADTRIFKRFQKASVSPVFHESWAHENAFKATLTPEQVKLYDAAKKERQTTFERFLALWAKRL